MRMMVIAAGLLATAAAAGAQGRMTMPGPGPGQRDYGGQDERYAAGGFPGQHWGGQYRGHWIGGMRAPGGWGGYRRPHRGAMLSGYWMSPDFQLAEWSSYGLPQPPQGYRWSRYYDDAVLIDGRGIVYDRVAGLDWRRYDLDEAQGGRLDAYHANRDAYGAAGGGYGYPQETRGDRPGYDEAGAPPPRDYGRHGGSRGFADDRALHDREEGPPPGAGYPVPGFAPPAVIQSGSGTVVTTSTADGVSSGTYVNGYYYPPAGVTTVTVASTPVVTTTTEVFDDTVTYRRSVYHAAAARKVYRKRVWRRPVPVCYCR